MGPRGLAGIPAAGGIVEYVEHNYGRKFARATQPTYPDVMAELHERERRDVIGHFVDSDDLRVNWAHLCIGLLVHEGFVDRVLTTNFDPLVVRACAMLDDFPPVYDFGTSQLFQPANTPDKAVFYLHGQRSGFRMLHTVAECADHAKRLAPLIHETVQGRTVIVVGYSGANDPVFDLLAETD